MDPPEHTRVRRTTPAGAGPTVTARAAQPPAANHPRWCGADRTRDGRRRAEGEPPPHAGPTRVLTVETSADGNHPRWCGADHARVLATAIEQEPPPLVRGRHPGERQRAGVGGTTPAGAGPTRPPGTATRSSRNHPRWCGADTLYSGRALISGEPPPLVRGRQRRPQVRDGSERTTPAGAGPTGSAQPPLRRVWNHPRWRGADAHSGILSAPDREPPPLVRGRHHHRRTGSVLLRTTPAGAGPTRPPGTATRSSRNHPRWCGADKVRSSPRVTDGEPPPLVRGRRAGGPGDTPSGRTTPAGAGPTVHPGPVHGCCVNHPRWCGADTCWPGVLSVIRVVLS